MATNTTLLVPQHSEPTLEDDKAPSHLQSSRGGGARGRGRSRGRGRGQTSSRSPFISKPPATVAPPVVPKPKALSTSQAILKNDPMFDDSFAGPEGPSYQVIRQTPKFYPSLCGIDDIIDEIFTTLQVMDNNFKLSISSSMFAYYCQQLLVARVIAIRHDFGDTSRYEEAMLDCYKTSAYPVPGLLDQYFRSIGDFTMLNGTKYHIALPDYSFNANEPGWEKVTPATLFKWQNFPHSFTYCCRIQHDIAYTDDLAVNRNWNLPVNLRPDNVGGQPPGNPTANLCGWRRSEELTSDQINILTEAGITTLQFPTDGYSRRFNYNRELMQQIKIRLNEMESKYAMVIGPYLSSIGSIGQEPKVHMTDTPIIFDRNKHHSFYSPIYMTAVEALDPRLTWSSTMFLFRLDRQPIGGLHTWSCYDWTNYRHVPQTWIDQRNALLNLGHVGLINVRHLISNTVDRRSLIQRSCAKSQKLKGFD